MNIEIKYETGQDVWYMRDNCPRLGTIINFQATMVPAGLNICYYIREDGEDPNISPEFINEHHVYPSKKELLESL